jgi:hypothetical protein
MVFFLAIYVLYTCSCSPLCLMFLHVFFSALFDLHEGRGRLSVFLLRRFMWQRRREPARVVRWCIPDLEKKRKEKKRKEKTAGRPAATALDSVVSSQVLWPAFVVEKHYINTPAWRC